MLQDEAFMFQIGYANKDGGKLWVILNDGSPIGYAFAHILPIGYEMKMCVAHKQYEMVPADISSQVNEEIMMWSIARGADEMTVVTRSLS